jgi:hypothetical protein
MLVLSTGTSLIFFTKLQKVPAFICFYQCFGAAGPERQGAASIPCSRIYLHHFNLPKLHNFTPRIHIKMMLFRNTGFYFLIYLCNIRFLLDNLPVPCALIYEEQKKFFLVSDLGVPHRGHSQVGPVCPSVRQHGFRNGVFTTWPLNNCNIHREVP